MPFVERVVEPKFLSRTSLRDENGKQKVTDEELQAVTNCTLSNALRQLASLVLLAEDIFCELTGQLEAIKERSKAAQAKIVTINELVEKYDPKKVPVPEGSLSDFALRKVHYTAQNPLKKELFTVDSRPTNLRKLYEKATTDRISASILDQLRKDSQHSPFLLCTPVLSTKRRRDNHRIDDIESRIPSVVEQLRKWTSREAIGDVTALPDASMRIISSVTLTPDELSECGSGDDEPIDHRLPSPEEQLRIIASKFSPELVPIDTSGRFFDRMCTSRKSLHVELGTGETDTVKRRTRTRKPRGKRRNTISGTDQKELREAIAGDTSNAVASEEVEDSIVMRSRSSDLLKKSPIDPVIKKGHFNSLKQWGRNRLKMIGRSPSASRDSFKDSSKTDRSRESMSPVAPEEVPSKESTVTLRKKRAGDDDRRTHQRCASYSSSEKSIGVPSGAPTTATINCGVKLRGTSTQRRLRRSGTGKEEPHSSSGNWSASSESGRTSIGSEITTTTVPPKSTTSAGTSNNSLNCHHGPPSSIISRRRFLNTSGSGSVTSEGTLTPDIIHDLHEDLETSSEFSCDTEGYYTSFHMDSGLKTLKEEEISPSTPLHTSTALSSNSSTSQNLTAENEYELFGKGSTSTTTSSAGTVCTTLMAAGSDRSLAVGPTVPERKSSLTKMNRNRSNNVHSANASLDRSSNSFTKSPFSSLRYNAMRSYTDKHIYNQSTPEINNVPNSTVTITRGIGNNREITAVAEVHTETDIEYAKKSTGTSSPDSGHNTSSSPIEDSVSSAHGKNSLSEQDYSESSDLEGTDRIERIRYKTTINSSRIPSMCVITPTNSDDEGEPNRNESAPVKKQHTERHNENIMVKSQSRPKLDIPSEEKLKDHKNVDIGKTNKTYQIKSSLQPFNNLMCKLKGVLPNKLSNKKSPVAKGTENIEDFFDTGDYVTIADVKNNNKKMSFNRGNYVNNDVIGKNLQSVLSGKPETEYVSLNELPNCLTTSKDYLDHSLEEKPLETLEEMKKKGAKVTLDSHGQVIYSSDTLKRRKGAHTTFEPGPFVQEISPTTAVIQREKADIITVTDETDFGYDQLLPSSKPTSPQLGKMIIKAPLEPHGLVTKEFVTLPPPKPNTIITATPVTETPTLANTPSATITNKNADLPRIVEALTRTGAYVNIHDADGVSLSPTKDDNPEYLHSNADKPLLNGTQTVPRHNGPTVDLNTLSSTLRPNNVGQHSGKHGVINYNNVPRGIEKQPPKFWTLPKRTNQQDIHSNFNSQRSQNYPRVTANQKKPEYQRQLPTQHEDSIRISPIDPRASTSFKSSTPTSKDNVVDLTSKLLSPVKSTMTNEELYAVIHKSKKKLNIKEMPERAESPALSTISLSPVSSETCLYGKGTQRHPETGYLGDPRSRMSWSPADKVTGSPTAGFYGAQKQDTTCADRHGPIQQTSRLDFKKLLLQHSVKLNTLPQQKSNKLSAVEQLKISKEKVQAPMTPPGNRSKINILDLSSSPKIYNQRKVIKIGNHPSSPGRANALLKDHKNAPKILLSPKSQWRFSSPRSDVLSTPIPEANEETSNSSGEKRDSPVSPPSKTVPIVTNQHFGARRNLIPIRENTDTEAHITIHQGVFPLNSEYSPSQGLSRTEILQAKRAEFFNSPPELSQPALSSFKKPTQASRSKASPERGNTSPSTLETAL